MSDEAVDKQTPRASDLPGTGVDRTLIRAMLALSPVERIARLQQEAHFVRQIDAARAAAREQTRARLAARVANAAVPSDETEANG